MNMERVHVRMSCSCGVRNEGADSELMPVGRLRRSMNMNTNRRSLDFACERSCGQVKLFV